MPFLSSLRAAQQARRYLGQFLRRDAVDVLQLHPGVTEFLPTRCKVGRVQAAQLLRALARQPEEAPLDIKEHVFRPDVLRRTGVECAIAERFGARSFGTRPDEDSESANIETQGLSPPQEHLARTDEFELEVFFSVETQARHTPELLFRYHEVVAPRVHEAFDRGRDIPVGYPENVLPPRVHERAGAQLHP